MTDYQLTGVTFDMPPEIAQLVAAIHKPLAEFYRAGPPTHERAYDAMTALAIVAACIIAGTEAEMYKWFGEAVYEAVNRMADAVREQDQKPDGTVLQ